MTMNGKTIPSWAWIGLGTSFILSIIIAVIGTMVLLDEKDTETPIMPTNELYPAQVEVAQLSTFTPDPTATATSTITPQPTLTDTSTTFPTVSAPSETTSPTEEAIVFEECTPPDSWQSHTVRDGETLFAFQLGSKYAGNPTTVDEIMHFNCLGTTLLQVGQVLWLPPGAAEQAPSSEPSSPGLPAGIPRTANCPCTIAIRPGWRLEQIADAIDRIPVAFAGADFMAVAGPGAPMPSHNFLASVPPGTGLEGFMLPGTYTLQNDTSAVQFRDMMLDAFNANAAAIAQAAAPQGISAYQAVILASIIQKESGDPNEQRLVASVFYNRLNSDKALGATVTLMYALGRPGAWWPYPSGQTGLDSPYNTFIYGGFPPTPISSPSISALQAVASPAQTNYLYFTGNCNGPGNLYAETYEQHLANVRACQ